LVNETICYHLFMIKDQSSIHDNISEYKYIFFFDTLLY